MRAILSPRGRVAAPLFVLILCHVALADFASGNIAILRLGDGTSAVSDLAQALFLDEYDSVTGSLIDPHATPSTGSAALTLCGSGGHDGHLTLSSDGRYLIGSLIPRGAVAWPRGWGGFL